METGLDFERKQRAMNIREFFKCFQLLGQRKCLEVLEKTRLTATRNTVSYVQHAI